MEIAKNQKLFRKMKIIHMWQIVWRYNDHVEIQTASEDFTPFMAFQWWEECKCSLWMANNNCHIRMY